MKRPCSWCEGEFKADLGGRNTGKSHGICKRHMDAQYKQMGMNPPDKGEGSFDLSTLPPQERKLLGFIYTVVKKRQQAKGVWQEGRCEDWPCCGHGDDCPDRDPETGEEVWGCAHCGAPLPRGARSSLCNRCIQDMHRRMDDPTGQDLDN